MATPIAEGTFVKYTTGLGEGGKPAFGYVNSSGVSGMRVKPLHSAKTIARTAGVEASSETTALFQYCLDLLNNTESNSRIRKEESVGEDYVEIQISSASMAGGRRQRHKTRRSARVPSTTGKGRKLRNTTA
jgi:hypothetical protein